MARESYVHPVTGADEPPPRWVPLWRFRATLMAMALVMGAIAVVIVQYMNGNFQGQDPTFQPGGAGLNPQSTATTSPKPTAKASPGAKSTTRPSTAPTQLGGPG